MTNTQTDPQPQEIGRDFYAWMLRNAETVMTPQGAHTHATEAGTRYTMCGLGLRDLIPAPPSYSVTCSKCGHRINRYEHLAR